MAFTVCYLGLCRILGLLRSSRRTETDKGIETMVLRHRCVSSSANSMRVSPIAPWIGRSSPPSAGCCRDGAGAPSSSRQRRSFVGTESSRGANGGAGDPRVALVGLKGAITAALECRHRGHARVEDRVRCWKDCGLKNLPFASFTQNLAWVATSLIAGALIAWAQMTCLEGELKNAEPKTLRNRLL